MLPELAVLAVVVLVAWPICVALRDALAERLQRWRWPWRRGEAGALAVPRFRDGTFNAELTAPARPPPAQEAGAWQCPRCAEWNAGYPAGSIGWLDNAGPPPCPACGLVTPRARGSEEGTNGWLCIPCNQWNADPAPGAYSRCLVCKREPALEVRSGRLPPRVADPDPSDRQRAREGIRRALASFQDGDVAERAMGIRVLRQQTWDRWQIAVETGYELDRRLAQDVQAILLDCERALGVQVGRQIGNAIARGAREAAEALRRLGQATRDVMPTQEAFIRAARQAELRPEDDEPEEPAWTVSTMAPVSTRERAIVVNSVSDRVMPLTMLGSAMVLWPAGLTSVGYADDDAWTRASERPAGRPAPAPEPTPPPFQLVAGKRKVSHDDET